MKLFVLGIDGASYRLIHRFVEEDKLPSFKKLIKEGIFRKLKTTNPPHTAPGWTNAFTGVQPGKHGIYQFWDTQSPNYYGEYMGSNHVGVPTVWEILNQFSYKTIMINIPMTYPPKEVNGVMISWPLSNTLRYAYPKDMLFKIAKAGGHYASDINIMFENNLEYISQAIEITKKRVKTIDYFLKNGEWDLFISVFTEIDRISHYYWNFMDKSSPVYNHEVEEKYKLAIENIYRETDLALGKILEMLPSDALLMLLSDHGFTVGEVDFYVQTFLMKHSLLAVKEIDKKSIKENSWFYMEEAGKEYEVDWNQTTAYMASPGSYGVNINLKGRQNHGIIEQEQYEQERDKIISLLKKILHPNKKTPLFRDVLKREEVYAGASLNKAPDIIMVPYEYSTMVHHKIHPDKIFGKPEQKGMHDKDAIFGLYGQNIQLKESGEIALEDITPTILNLFAIRTPSYMEGESMIQFNDEQENWKDFVIPNVGSGGYKGEEAYTREKAYTREESQEVAEKLKSLGYL